MNQVLFSKDTLVRPIKVTEKSLLQNIDISNAIPLSFLFEVSRFFLQYTETYYIIKTPVFNSDDNNKCFLSTNSAY